MNSQCFNRRLYQLFTNQILSLQDILDSIEFARGSASSTWGSVRAAMGHPEPFELKYVAIGNEDCGKPNYRGSVSCYDYIISILNFFNGWSTSDSHMHIFSSLLIYMMRTIFLNYYKISICMLKLMKCYICISCTKTN